MGRIKTTLLKRITQQLMKEHGAEFKEDYETNKEIVARYIDTSSKKFRNIIAGYVTRLVKAKKITE